MIKYDEKFENSGSMVIYECIIGKFAYGLRQKDEKPEQIFIYMQHPDQILGGRY